MSHTFTPYALKNVTLRNRIAVAPMCQYSAVDGVTGAWHRAHYAALARGGAGLVVVEATAVSPEGRITPGCTGLYNDTQAEGMAAIAADIASFGAVPGIQIGHAGRKASANRPWEGDDHMAEGDPRGWPTLSASAVAFGGALNKVPKAMTEADIARVQNDFVAAARRAHAAGFRWLELHFAHGYLGQCFYSRHANQRTDGYGQDNAGRNRFLVETLAAVRKVWPESLPLTARFGVVEFDGHDEERFEEVVQLVRRLRGGGLDLLSASIGFTTPDVKIPWGPGMLLPYAARVRREVELPVATGWNLDAPEDIERGLAQQQVDLVMVARAHLANPHYAFQVALALGEPKPAYVLPTAYAHWLERYRGGGQAGQK